jgi:hypothetical protein
VRLRPPTSLVPARRRCRHHQARRRGAAPTPTTPITPTALTTPRITVVPATAAAGPGAGTDIAATTAARRAPLLSSHRTVDVGAWVGECHHRPNHPHRGLSAGHAAGLSPRGRAPSRGGDHIAPEVVGGGVAAGLRSALIMGQRDADKRRLAPGHFRGAARSTHCQSNLQAALSDARAKLFRRTAKAHQCACEPLPSPLEVPCRAIVESCGAPYCEQAGVADAMAWVLVPRRDVPIARALEP